MTVIKTPLVPPEVVRWLEALYPDRCPDPHMSEREVWMAAGAANVVRRLQRQLIEQAHHTEDDE